MAAKVLMHVGTTGARRTRLCADKDTHPVMQKYGAFRRHQAALIALSEEGNRQVASGPLSEMIQNNPACQEAHGSALNAEVV